MVLGGEPYAESREIEILDSEKQGRSCSASVNFPVGVSDATGGVFKDTGIVQCGGRKSDDASSATEKCYYLAQDGTFHEATFSLQTKRFSASSVALPNGTIVVIGGADQYDNRLKTIEIIDTVNGDVSVLQQTLPEPISDHCSILVNQSVFIIGGYNVSHSNKTFIMDLQTLKITPGPEMEMARSYFGCATMNSRVIVAGGWTSDYISVKTSEYLDLKSNNPSWQRGKLNKTSLKIC